MLALSSDDLDAYRDTSDERLCKDLEMFLSNTNLLLREVCKRENLDVYVRVPEASGPDFKKFYQVVAEVTRTEKLL